MKENEVFCTSCKSRYILSDKSGSQEPHYCPFCGKGNLDDTHSIPSSNETSISLVQESIPSEDAVKFTLGPYKIIDTIGKGGMGEVFLAYDTSCGRRIAIKRVRTDLEEHDILYDRFLKEARITSQLTHPAIIPIYAIHDQGDHIYYTMPYVEGQTLKQILRKTRQQEKNGEPLDYLGGSIPALIRVMITICHAVAYAHANKVIHRDLKPENIIVGKFGEVMILDWGLAKLFDTPAMETVTRKRRPRGAFTRLGKVVGTVTYMAPERAMGDSATVQTDIYSLGVILYQMLTLHSPFRRGSLKEFRKNILNEVLQDPSEVSPYRDISKMLSEVCKKCLAFDPEERYATVEELIRDLENYIEGRSEWFQITKLDIFNKDVWEFQENVFIAEHVAITQSVDMSDWVNLMISKASFTESIMLEAQVKIHDEGHGIGFLMSIPEAAERKHLNDGYCLWIGTDNHPATKLLRSTVEVVSYPEIFLKRGKWYNVRIEKVENNIHLYLNNKLQLTYIGHAPVVGKHVGLLTRDADYDIKDFYVHIGGQMATVSCLAIPDAFLAHKDYDKALNEYRRIGYSFIGRQEGRDALFRAGITLLEKAKESGSEKDFDNALFEFSKLHDTPGAPLEYLGKALVYQRLNDFEEEVKCYFLAFRRYPKHPLLNVLAEQVSARMHEASRSDRIATYTLIYLTVRHIPEVAATLPSRKLFESLKNHWEPLPFFNETENEQAQFALQLAFWLNKPLYIEEIIGEQMRNSPENKQLLHNGVYALIALGAKSEAQGFIEELDNNNPLRLLYESSTQKALNSFENLDSYDSQRVFCFLLEKAIEEDNEELVLEYGKKFDTSKLPSVWSLKVDCLVIWAHLKKKHKAEAGQILNKYPLEMISHETSLLYFLYGCWLGLCEGEEMAYTHFSGALDVPFPRTWSLTANYLNGQIGQNDRWTNNSFPWERDHLFRQLELYYLCTGNTKKSEEAKVNKIFIQKK